VRYLVGVFRVLWLPIVCLSLINCAFVPSSSRSPSVDAVPLANKVALQNQSLVKKKLYVQLNEWKGVPFQFGGLSKKGIDCSGFVLHTYKSQFGYLLPRTTKFQSKVGFQIDQNDLRAGDLVFFKTGLTTRHVGMYVEGGKILHASTSKGVMVSRLDNVYWHGKYWKSMRIE